MTNTIETENLDRFWERTDAPFHDYGTTTYYTSTWFELRDDWGEYGNQVSRQNQKKCAEFALRLWFAELVLWAFLALILFNLTLWRCL